MATKYKKRKDGRYQASIVIGIKPNGKPNRKYVYAKSINELELKLAEQKVMHSKGLVLKNEGLTFKEMGELWFNLTKENKEYNTIESIERILRLHVYPTLGHLKLKNIKTYHIQDLINTKQKNGLTDTVRKMLNYIKSILNMAVANDFVLKNVASSVSTPRFKAKEKKILTAFERSVIETVAKTHKHGDMIMLFMYSGIRREELIPLEEKNIDLNNNQIKILNAIYFKNNQAVLKTTKNGDERVIPILNKVREILECRCKKSNSKYLFPMYNGNMMSETSFKEAMDSFRNACNKYIDKLNEEITGEKKYEYFHFTAHTFRHTFCTFLYYAGVQLKEAQEIMGHRSSNVTMDIYTHLDLEQRNNSNEKLNAYLDNL